MRHTVCGRQEIHPSGNLASRRPYRQMSTHISHSVIGLKPGASLLPFFPSPLLVTGENPARSSARRASSPIRENLEPHDVLAQKWEGGGRNSLTDVMSSVRGMPHQGSAPSDPPGFGGDLVQATFLSAKNPAKEWMKVQPPTSGWGGMVPKFPILVEAGGEGRGRSPQQTSPCFICCRWKTVCRLLPRTFRVLQAERQVGEEAQFAKAEGMK